MSDTIKIKVIRKITDIDTPVDINRVIEIYKKHKTNVPIEDIERMVSMYENSNLIIGAFTKDGKMVGIARALTDFEYVCYLADLVVDMEHQGLGIGKKLIKFTQELVTNKCTFLLSSSNTAKGFYAGMDLVIPAENCFEKKREI